MAGSARPSFAFGPFLLDPVEQSLLRDGKPVPLTPKALDLLLYLVEHRGRLVKKEEMLAAVWPGTFVEEAVLSVNMSTIRRALGDDRNTYVETVPRHGYRFVAPVQQVPAVEPESLPADGAAGLLPPAGETKPGRARRIAWVAVAATLAVVGLVTLQIRRHAASVAPSVGSIAVLPLQNLSSSPDEEQFASAMTDLLITDLGRIPALRVVSRQSVIQYADSRTPMREIARDLKVEYITEGTVTRDGNRVRITAQLIHGPTDRHLWARSYERDLRGVFALQSEVAESIAREIGVTLAVAPAAGRTEPYVPAAAYEAFLRGNTLLDSGQSTAAIAQFRKAIELSPDFADAYTRVASAYFNLGYFGALPPSQAFPSMKEAALKAIEKDDQNAAAHAALAEAKLHYEWDWQGADREFRRSLALNPSDSDVRHLYAHYLLTVGHPDDSLAEMDRAFEIDPVGVFTAI